MPLNLLPVALKPTPCYSLPGGPVVAYLYDALSRLISSQLMSGQTTTYHYDGWNRIAEFAQSGTSLPPRLFKTYTWGTDLSGTAQGAGGVGGLLWGRFYNTTTQISTHLYCYDGNGNVTALVDAATGQTSASYDYGPFGELLKITGPYAKRNPYRFSTKPQDETTGLLYYGYRWYDARTGRWPSRDPIEEDGGMNLYSFVGNDGVNWTDQLGHRPLRQVSSGSNVIVGPWVSSEGNVIVGPWGQLPSTGRPGGYSGPVSPPNNSSWMGVKTAHGGTVTGLDVAGRPALISYPPGYFEGIAYDNVLNGKTEFDKLDNEWISQANSQEEMFDRFMKVSKCRKARADKIRAESTGVKLAELKRHSPFVNDQDRNAWCCKANQALNRLNAMSNARNEWDRLGCDQLPASKNHTLAKDQAAKDADDLKKQIERACK